MNQCIKHTCTEAAHLHKRGHIMTPPSHFHTNIQISIFPPTPLTHTHKTSLTLFLLHTQTQWSLQCNLCSTDWHFDLQHFAVWQFKPRFLQKKKKDRNTQLLPFPALFRINNGAVILKWHPCAIHYSAQHILCWLFIITMRRMIDLWWSKCDFDLVLTR